MRIPVFAKRCALILLLAGLSALPASCGGADEAGFTPLPVGDVWINNPGLHHWVKFRRRMAGTVDFGPTVVLSMPITCKSAADPEMGQNLLETLPVGGWEFEFESDVGFVSAVYPLDVQEDIPGMSGMNVITINETGGTCPP